MIASDIRQTIPLPLDLSFVFTMAFLVSEVLLSRVRRSKTMKRDRGSLRLLHWTIGVSIGAGVTVAMFGVGFYPLPDPFRSLLCIGLLLGGAIIRWISIAQLGKQFTVAVEIQHGHRLFTTGMYRFVRHPSYSGLVLEFLGLATYFSNWISQLVILIPVLSALAYRIHVEELVLKEEFDGEYEDYISRTSRLIPGIW